MGFGEPLCVFMEELGESSRSVSDRSLGPGKSNVGNGAKVAYGQAVRLTVNVYSTVCALAVGCLMNPKVLPAAVIRTEEEPCRFWVEACRDIVATARVIADLLSFLYFDL